jgi:hypothetical protein
VYDDCDIPVSVVSDHLLSGGISVADNFVVGNDGGITRSGNAEASEAEDEKDDTKDEKDGAPAVLGRGQRKRITAWRYQGPAWEEH